jgi:hypothetical protein
MQRRLFRRRYPAISSFLHVAQAEAYAAAEWTSSTPYEVPTTVKCLIDYLGEQHAACTIVDRTIEFTIRL